MTSMWVWERTDKATKEIYSEKQERKYASKPSHITMF